jgi:hypothetical protein
MCKIIYIGALYYQILSFDAMGAFISLLGSSVKARTIYTTANTKSV